MRVLAAQINPVIGDVRGNTEKVLEALAYAREHGVDIVCFPEMTLCGYAPEDLVLLKGFVEEMEGALERVVAASRGVVVLMGL